MEESGSPNFIFPVRCRKQFQIFFLFGGFDHNEQFVETLQAVRKLLQLFKRLLESS